ncbi:hypothetical protein [Desulfobulbus propionicus]|jgi:hypothetical protein|uniref:hypothetical protein n=1 Tax=Desulfobulbus propionicus TaxID=894 RepID=UPI00146B175A|nr:hypothetical protein [Desulfobulbus propionicus]
MHRAQKTDGCLIAEKDAWYFHPVCHNHPSTTGWPRFNNTAPLHGVTFPGHGNELAFSYLVGHDKPKQRILQS